MDALIALAESGVREQAQQECRKLIETLDGLSPAGWRTHVPTCGEWTVRELASHIAFVAEMLGSSLRKSLAGHPGAVWEDMATARGQIYAAKKALTEDQLITDVRSNVAAISATLDKVQHDDLAKPCWHPAGMWTVARIVVQWLWEVSLHRYDLMAALGKGAQMNGETVAICLDYLSVASGRYLNPQADPELVATYRVITRDPARTQVYRLANGTAEVVAGDTVAPADVTLRTDGQTWLLAFVNRVDRADGGGGKIRIDGDSALYDRFWKCVRNV